MLSLTAVGAAEPQVEAGVVLLEADGGLEPGHRRVIVLLAKRDPSQVKVRPRIGRVAAQQAGKELLGLSPALLLEQRQAVLQPLFGRRRGRQQTHQADHTAQERALAAETRDSHLGR